jgi:hypothetical protein
MKYIDVKWKNKDINYPIRLVSEIGLDGFEIRKLEFFENGSVQFASSNSYSSNTRLGEKTIPDILDINNEKEFDAIEITKVEFENLWKIHFINNIL